MRRREERADTTSMWWKKKKESVVSQIGNIDRLNRHQLVLKGLSTLNLFKT